MPLVSKTFDQLLDFTRTSAATFVGSNGLIQNTAASRNLLTFTQQFDNAAWTKTNTTVTANSTVAPDGTSTADTLTASAGAGAGQQTFQTITNIGSGNYVYSIYAKQGSGATDSNSFIVRNQTTGVNPAAITFNYQTGVVTQTEGSGATAVSAGNGWWRIAIPFTLTATVGDAIRFYTGSSGAVETPGEFIYVWGAQAELGSTATTYTRNNGGVFPPRFDYDPVTLAPKGLLVEEQRTNLLTYSAQFDNAAWFKSAGSVTANTTTSPNGTVDADAFIEDTSTGTHIVRFQPFTVTSGVTYTAAVYVKANGRNRVRLINFDGVTSFVSIFNLSTGTVASGTGTIISVGNGWYRITQTFASASTVATNFAYQISLDDGTTNSYTGDGTSGIYLYGAQLEAGAFPTSYIPTVASQVTRTADQTSIVAPNFAPWYNQSEGTFVVEADTFKPTTLAATAEAVSVNDGTSANRAVVRLLTANAEGLNVTGGAVVAQITQAYSANAVEKLAFAIKANDFAFARNGSLAGSDTSGAMPVSVDRLSIGGPSPLNGHIRSIRYYPVRLSNAQLQALTA